MEVYNFNNWVVFRWKKGTDCAVLRVEGPIPWLRVLPPYGHGTEEKMERHFFRLARHTLFPSYLIQNGNFRYCLHHTDIPTGYGPARNGVS